MAQVAFAKAMGPKDDTGLAEWATAKLCDMAAELKADYYRHWARVILENEIRRGNKSPRLRPKNA